MFYSMKVAAARTEAGSSFRKYDLTASNQYLTLPYHMQRADGWPSIKYFGMVCPSRFFSYGSTLHKITKSVMYRPISGE